MAVRAEHVFRWDLDKTYLRSEFTTIKDLVKNALESAEDKRAFPGAAALLRALRKDHNYRICIVSGSPAVMRRKLAQKLALDGIEYDEFVLKNSLRNLRKFRFRAMRAQIPYKLPALLESRAGLLGNPPETLFGDDAEADAIIYCLYADILSGRVDRHDLRRVLEASRAYDDQIARTVALAERVPKGDSVQRILIHLENKTATAGFAKFGARLVPIYNYFQAALVLHGDGVLGIDKLHAVACSMVEAPEFEIATLANSMQDLARRGRLPVASARNIAAELRERADHLADDAVCARALADELDKRCNQLGDSPSLEWSEQAPVLDYVELADAEHRARQEKH